MKPSPTQMALFPAAPEAQSAIFNDPAFASNKEQPIHRWVPWIAGFSAEFVQSALARSLTAGSVVLDPFAGVGTTLVEALRAGHQAIGFEINPYAALACKVKSRARAIEPEKLREAIRAFDIFYRTALSEGRTPTSEPPPGFRTRAPFYSPRVLHKVLLVQDWIACLESEEWRELFRLAFAATMVRYSNYSYEPSLGRRVSAGKAEIDDFPVGDAIVGKLEQIAEDSAWLAAQGSEPWAGARIINDSCFEALQYMAATSVDLVVTSPPYLNNYHYNRNTRPQLYWLDYAQNPASLKPLERANFGKYWQTVRDQATIELAFDLVDSGLASQLERLRELHPAKGIYGGHGWANYATSYFNDCHRLAQLLQSVLKPGGHALIVLGNSILQGEMIPTDSYMAQIAQAVGLELVSIDIPRATRVGNSIIQSDVRVAKAAASHQLYEGVVELRRPSAV